MILSSSKNLIFRLDYYVTRCDGSPVAISKSSYYQYRAGVTFQPSKAEQEMTHSVKDVFCGAARAG